MRVLVSTTAGAGHLGPLIPFATALRDRGHEVAVAAPEAFGPTVAQAGFSLHPCADIPTDALGRMFGEMQAMSFEERNSHYVREVFGRLAFRARLADVRREVEDWRPDLILREAEEIASFVVAETSSLQQVQVATGLASLDDVVSRILAEPLDEVGISDGEARLQSVPRLSFVPPSFEVASARASWARRFRWQDSSPGAELPDWGSASAPLVYVTFGSEAGGGELFPGFYRGVLDQLAVMPIRVLLTVGKAADPDRLGSLPANAYAERWWPQGDVVPQASAVVAHGGFGTTLSALSSGVPMVVIPLFALDQHHNARRVGEVGAGIPIAAGPAGIGDLRNALTRVLEEDSFGEAARRIAEDIKSLPLASEAVPILEELALR